jgi:hypothetical protein
MQRWEEEGTRERDRERLTLCWWSVESRFSCHRNLRDELDYAYCSWLELEQLRQGSRGVAVVETAEGRGGGETYQCPGRRVCLWACN